MNKKQAWMDVMLFSATLTQFNSMTVKSGRAQVGT